MFCKWCGKRLSGNAGKCSACGKEQGPLENGTYFGDPCDGYGEKFSPGQELYRGPSNEAAGMRGPASQKRGRKKCPTSLFFPARTLRPAI